MLVVSRKRNEVVVIGSGPNEIRVMVVRIQGDKVRLGIEAPQDVKILRSELAEEVLGTRSRRKVG